jgi:two-component sensor histidine kinase/CheY-like chemotaxis protein
MNEDKDVQKQQKFMKIIDNSTQLLLKIINDILDFSRLEAGMGDFNIEETDIIALIMEVAEVYILDMKPEVRLLIDAPVNDIYVPTDANRVKQVFFNLVTNAIKYTEKGSITLKVEEGNEYLTFSVTDTGCGIPEDKLEVIFDRFEKLNRHAKGTGLGLAICESIIEQLGGNITVTSKVDEGSVFSFTIPYQYVAPKKGSIGSTRDFADNLRKKILLAETLENDLQFITNVLTNRYDVIEVTDNKKIISAFILENPNLILISKEIVDKSDDIIRKIRAISATIPIILMATSDFYYDQRWAIDNGCTNVISKPFSASSIEELVTTFIV